MNRLQQIRNRQVAIRARMADIEATQAPAADADEAVRAAFDALPAEVDALAAEFDELEAEAQPLQARADTLARIRGAVFPEAGPARFEGQAPAVHVRIDPFADLGRLRYARPEDIRSRALQAAERVSYDGPFRGHAAGMRERAQHLIDTVEGADALFLATSSPAYMSAFRSWLESKGQPVYTAEEAAAVRASMSLTSANGGYVLPFLLDPTLITTGAATKNPVRRIARVEAGTQNIWHGVTVSNVTTAWKGEGSAFTDGSPTTGGIAITAAMLTAYVTASYELFQDSNLQGQLPEVISMSIDFAESAAFLTGSGSTAPKGVITAVSGTAQSLVTCTTRGTFDNTSGVDTFALVNAIAPRYEDTAQLVANKVTLNKIRQQTVGTTGAMVTDIAMTREVLGLPYFAASTMVSATTSGNILAVAGDFSQYLVYDRLGVELEFIPNIVDGNGVPTGQRGLVAYKRVGGDVTDIDAFRLLKA